MFDWSKVETMLMISVSNLLQISARQLSKVLQSLISVVCQLEELIFETSVTSDYCLFVESFKLGPIKIVDKIQKFGKSS